MVQPNVPRLLYQGDRIVLQSRISNIDSTHASGIIFCKIEDEATGEDITGKLLSANQNSFSVSKKSNTSSAFEIKVPVTQLHPLKITVSIRSENFTDGEEHIIPVLSPKVFVRENKPFVLVNNSDTAVQLPSLAPDAEVYGIGLSILPKPQAALINSLPYLANYPYGCAEQIFNKLLAHVTALDIMRTDSMARLSFEKAKGFIEKEKISEDKLPDELAEETMPWLNMANKTVMQQRQLFDLLDTSKAVLVIEDLLQKLYKLQNTDGGLSWFNGGKSDFYISCYVLKGFGYLQKNRQTRSAILFENSHEAFIKNLMDYCDETFDAKQKEETGSWYPYYLYARGYWLSVYPMVDSIKSGAKELLKEQWKQADNTSLYNQALLILASLQYDDRNDELYKKAEDQLKSILQLAIEDQNGLRWKDLADADDLNNSAEETIALLAEAFETAGTNINGGIIKWLLTAKNEHSWKTTKATAAAVSLLAKEKKSVAGISQTITANDSISVTNDLLNGSSFEFIPLGALPTAIQLKKETLIAATGKY